MPKKAEKSVFRRPGTKFWHIRFTDKQGREIRLTTSTEDFDEACAMLRLYTQQVNENCVDRLVLRFWREHPVKPKTLKCYQGSYRNWFPYVGHLDVGSISIDHVRRFVSDRLSEVKQGTIRNDLAFLSSFISFTQMLPGGPTSNVVDTFSKRQLKVSKPRVKYLAEDQVAALMREIREPHQRLIALFGLEAGLRSGEILHLTVRQAEPRKRMIYLHPEDTKTSTGRRVPMTNRLTRAVIQWRRANPSLRPGDWLISNPETGKPYYDTKWWPDACQRAGLKDFRFHDTRHHFASMFVQSGGRLQPLARLLGHTSVAMSEKYAHMADDTAAAEFRRVKRGR